MTKRNSHSAEGDGEQFRISFILNLKHHPELRCLADISGHGDRPRELLRLAKLGLKAERQLEDLSVAAMTGGLRRLSAMADPVGAMRPAAAVVEPVAAAPAQPAHIEHATASQATRQDEREGIRQQPPKEEGAARANADRANKKPIAAPAGLGSFLA